MRFLRQFVQHVRRFVHPATLHAALRKRLQQRCPEAQRPIPGAFAGIAFGGLDSGLRPAVIRRHWLPALEKLAKEDERAGAVLDLARLVKHSAKEEKLLELLRKNQKDKTLVFANFRATLDRLRTVLTEAGFSFVVFSGAESNR